MSKMKIEIYIKVSYDTLLMKIYLLYHTEKKFLFEIKIINVILILILSYFTGLEYTFALHCITIIISRKSFSLVLLDHYFSHLHSLHLKLQQHTSSRHRYPPNSQENFPISVSPLPTSRLSLARKSTAAAAAAPLQSAPLHFRVSLFGPLSTRNNGGRTEVFAERYVAPGRVEVSLSFPRGSFVFSPFSPPHVRT